MKYLPWLVSIAAHAMILLAGNISYRPALIGLGSGRGSIDVTLVAAPAAAGLPAAAVTAPHLERRPPAPAKQLAAPLPAPRPLHSDLSSAQPVRIAAAEVQTIPTPALAKPQASSLTGEAVDRPLALPDTSGQELGSAVSGPDENRASGSAEGSKASAIVDAEPDYLSNPAPIYPQAARDLGQEGLVVLDVAVSAEGRPEAIKISKSSGYHLLDDAAAEVARDYRFRPATLGGVPIRSYVQVPFRFRLDH